MKFFLIKVISFYQKWISAYTRPSCKFYPTCSEYGKEAIDKYGAIRGTGLFMVRILRCHPWQTNQIDPLK